MAALAAALGRGLAPYLKSLVPVWWLAQFDGYAEAAAAARAGLAAAFPAAKQRDVLLFCRSEVCAQGAGVGGGLWAWGCCAWRGRAPDLRTWPCRSPLALSQLSLWRAARSLSCLVAVS